MHHTTIRNWLLKFAILGVYSFYVFTSRSPAMDGDVAEASKSIFKPMQRIVIVLPRRVIIIGKKIRIIIPRIPIPAPPHIS